MIALHALSLLTWLYAMIPSILLALFFSLFMGQFKDPIRESALPEYKSDTPSLNFEPCSNTKIKEVNSENWESALASLQNSETGLQCIDPRNAFSLIDQIINHSAGEYYPLAENLYFQSLKDTDNREHIKFIKGEANKVMPLLKEKEQKEWASKIEREDATLAGDIKRFWTLRDPVLSTQLNERLIEHWQRIAYARNEFSRNTASVYHTDDRGTIYVKFGAPSYKRSGMLFPDNTEIRSKLYDLSFSRGGINPQEMFNLNMSIKQQYMPKYYEVWVYRNLGSRQPILFIFGESAEKGTFGLRQSVEEFIPRGSFRMGISSSYSFGGGARGISAGPFLQMALYNELSTIDIFFGNQLTYYDQNWISYMNGDLNFSSLKMMNSPDRAERELDRIQELAPGTQSTLKGNLGYINQSHKTYRFLNDQFEPIYKVMVFSRPHEKLVPNDRLVYGHQKPMYRMEHSARVFDSNTELIYRSSGDTKPVWGEGFDVTTGNMLEVPFSSFNSGGNNSTVLISSELSRIQPNDTNQNQPLAIIASKINALEPKAPLPAINGSSPQVSDIIWGYKPGEINHDDEVISFTIPENSEMPYGKNLMIYFETYHPNADLNKLRNYRVEYLINRIKRRKVIDTDIRLTLNFSTAEPTAKEQLEIKTSELDPGKYRAIFRFSEIESATTFAERFVDFTVDKQD